MNFLTNVFIYRKMQRKFQVIAFFFSPKSFVRQKKKKKKKMFFEVLVRLKSDIAVIIFIKTHNYQE